MLSETRPVAPIAAVRGGPGTPAADVLTAFALRRKAEGVNVVGVIVPPEDNGQGGHGGGGHEGCECRSALIDLASGATINIHQDLGPGSQACNLNSSALAEAAGAVERAIADGTDLVILSRFGGQEAEHRGLMSAFQAAVAAGLPIACVVTPKAEAVWADFAEGLSVSLPPEAEALEAWWRAQLGARATAGLAAAVQP